MMNATLNIIVRVAGRQAQAQLGAIAAATNNVARVGSSGFGRYGSSVSAASSNMTGFLNKMHAATKAQASFSNQLNNNALVKNGKNLNWVGRQLVFNFTLPLVAAAAALFKMNMNLERGMTQVRKVYGDLNGDAVELKKEVDALETSFRLLSTRFGIHQAEVIDIAAAWASAGSAGVGLANNVQKTLEIMILGEMDAEQATQSLIAIQATWRLSTMAVEGELSELSAAMAVLNIVENETAVTMEGLIESFVRSSGAARAAGVTIEELAAFTAALVPATGSAAQAGNALKTIFTRLQAPTKETQKMLEQIGFTVSDPDWLGSTATEKIQKLADEWENLSTSQRDLAASTIASRWQVSKFDVLLNDVASGTGLYAKAMAASADADRNAAIYKQELLTVLESSPRKWDIMTNSMKNSLASAFIPMMPAIMNLMGLVTKLATAFANLSPDTRKWIMLALALIAVVGPILVLAGSVMNLIGVFQALGKTVIFMAGNILFPVFKAIGLSFLKFVVTPIMSAVGALVSAILGIGAPFWVVVGIIAAAAATVALIMSNDVENPVTKMVENIRKSLYKLPTIFVEVFKGIINVLQRMVGIVVDWLSYLNPFQRHSPSLVDNVRAGVAVILDEYSKLEQVPRTVARAMASLGAFKQVSSNDVKGFRRTELDEKVSKVAKINPEAGQAASTMVDDIMELEDALGPLSDEISRQSLLVAQLGRSYAIAEKVVAQAEQTLARITTELDAVSDKLADAHNKLDDLANMPIKGMRDMEDQIFNNSLAQKKLNLQLLQFEKNGQSIDKIRDKWAALNGDIEMLRGKKEDLRLAGAGSDVLSAYDDQIAALEAQKGELGDSAAEIENIQKQLDDLDLEGRFLELTQSITFDPLVRQIEQAVNGLDEMSFEDIIAGITQQQSVISALEPEYDRLLAAQKEAQAALDVAKAKRDEVGAQMDAEQAKLDELEQAYSDIKDLINEMESAMDAYVAAAAAAAEIDKAKKAGGDDDSLFEAAEGVDYEIAGGDNILGSEGGLEDIEKFNEDLQAEIDKMLADMGDLDIWGAIQDTWNTVWTKIREGWESVRTWLSDLWGNITDGIDLSGILPDWDWGSMFDTALGYLDGFVVSVQEVLSDIWDNVPFKEQATDAFKWLKEELPQWFEKAKERFWEFINPIIESLRGLKDDVEPVWSALKRLVAIAIAVLSPVVAAVVAFGMLIFNIAKNVMGPLVKGIGEAFAAVIKIIRGVISFIANVIMFRWGDAWNSLLSVVEGVFELIVTVIGTALAVIWGAIKGVLETIVSVFQFLWDKVVAIWDSLWNSVGNLWNNFVENVMGPIVDFINGVIGWFQDLYDTLVGHSIIPDLINAIVDWFLKLPTLILDALKWFLDQIVDAFQVMADAAFAILSWLWDRIQDVLKLIKWGFEHILQPAVEAAGDAIKWVFEHVIEPAFMWVWGRIEDIIDGIKWYIENVLKPVFTWVGDQIKWVFENVIGPAMTWLKDEVFKKIWDAIILVVQGAWNSLSGLFNGFGTIVDVVWQTMVGLYDKLKPILSGIGTMFASVWSGILSAVEGGINGFITGFNLLGGVINKISGLLGLGSPINTIGDINLDALRFSVDFGDSDSMIPRGSRVPVGGARPMYEEGGVVGEMGRTVGPMGAAVKGARAIVGEGSSVHPEFVVPTDPQYRKRAEGLYARLGSAIGAPMFAKGGVVGAAMNELKTTGTFDSKHQKRSRGLYSELGHTFGEDEHGYSNMDLFGIGGAIAAGASAAASGIGKVAGAIKDGAIKAIWTPVKGLANTAMDQIPIKFIRDIGKGIVSGVDGWVTGASDVWDTEAGTRKTLGALVPKAGRGSWKVIPPMLDAKGVPYKVLSTYRPGAVTRNTGKPSWHGMDRAIDLSGPTGMINYRANDLLAINLAIYDAYKGQLHELIYGGPGARNVMNGRDHQFSGALNREHINHVHASLARGGMVVPRTPGGSLLRVGEGLHDEKVQVIPLHGKAGSDGNGETTIHFHGNLVFPNIQSPDDAERLIANLESLAGVKK